MSDKRTNRTKVLEQLIRDCSRFDFNEEESLAYINGRTGGDGIERSQFYAIKRRIKVNESKTCEERLFYHAKSGFLINHFKRMDEAEHLQSVLFRTLHNQVSMPVKKQSPIAVYKIASCIMANSRYLHELNVASPIVNQIKEYMHSNIYPTRSEENSKISQDIYSDDSSAMGTPNQLERVFKTVRPELGVDQDRVFSKERKPPPDDLLNY